MTSFLCRAVVPVLFVASLARGQESKPKEPAPARQEEPAKQPDAAKAPSAADIEKWAKLAAPGDHHKRLQLLVGKWDLEVSAPGQSPAKGTGEYGEILGGRFVTEHVKCVLGDQPFEWYGTYGYDNARKKYTAVWMDNLGTGMDMAEGNNEGDVIQLRGEREEVPGEKIRYKWIIRIRDKDTFSIEMLDIGADGKDVPAMKISMKRAK
jgi:hypothetical protein